MQAAQFFIFLVALAISGASAGWVEDGCLEVICHKTGPDESHENPRDKCSYCCCYDDSLFGKHAEYRPCMYGTHYDHAARNCSGVGCQTPQTCEEMKTCTSNDVIIAPNDPSGCSFCCCENGIPKTSKCPNFGGYYGKFDESRQHCVPSKSCGIFRL